MNKNVRMAVADIASQVWYNYRMGNKLDARLAFHKLPESRRPLCVLYLTDLALADNDMEALYSFVHSVTE
jgi:hypothetical protein